MAAQHPKGQDASGSVLYTVAGLRSDEYTPQGDP